MIDAAIAGDSAFAFADETPQTFEPMPRERLPDRLARRIRLMVQGGARTAGDRLPSIGEMARRFGVGHQSIREALKKLETMGVVEIRHGSGVYVRREDAVMIATPARAPHVREQDVLELLRARMPLEAQATSDAASHATPAQLREMRKTLALTANEHDEERLHALDTQFHRQIVAASGNAVLMQLMDVLHEWLGDRQQHLFRIAGSVTRNHEDHVSILEAIETADETLASARMLTHLQGAYDEVLQWQRRAGVQRAD